MLAAPRRSRSARLLPVVATVVVAAFAVPGRLPSAQGDLAQHVARTDEPGNRRVLFPVPTGANYSNDWHAPRSGGRLHMGNDLFAPKHTPLVAVTNGKVSFMRVEDSGLSGRMLTVRDDDGWQYRYIHLNNDTPGTDDGVADPGYTLVPGIEVGTRVNQGQQIAWLGDSGNAEGSSPHLHFEVLTPGGENVNPYASLQLSQGRRVGNLCRFDDNPPARPGSASGPGYRAVDRVGGVFTFGDVGYFGSVPELRAAGLVPGSVRVVAIESTPSGLGYWLVDEFGGVFAFGDAVFFGSVPQLRGAGLIGPQEFPLVAIAVTPSGQGYWLLDRNGGLYTFGDAGFFGSVPGMGLCAWSDAVGMAASQSGKGYWVQLADGRLLSFGDARYLGGIDDVAPRGPGAVGIAGS